MPYFDEQTYEKQDYSTQMLPKGKSLLVSDWLEKNWTKITEKESALVKPLIYSSLLDNEPLLMPIKRILEEFVKHRQQIVVKRTIIAPV